MYAAIHSDDPQSQQARATEHNEYSETHILGPHIFVSLEIPVAAAGKLEDEVVAGVTHL